MDDKQINNLENNDMEISRDKKKSSNIVILLLLLVILGLTGYITYDTIAGKDKGLLYSNSVECNNKCVTDNKLCEECANLSEICNKDCPACNCSKTTDYQKYISTLSKRKYVKDVVVSDGYIDSGDNEYIAENAYLGIDGVLYLDIKDKTNYTAVPGYYYSHYDVDPTLKAYKTPITNVVDVFSGVVGQAGVYALFVLKDDGNLYRVNISSNSKYELTKININNVVNVYSASTDDAEVLYAVDINGNIYNYIEYMVEE